MKPKLQDLLELYKQVSEKPIKNVGKLFNDVANLTKSNFFKTICLSCPSAISNGVDLAYTTIVKAIYDNYKFALLKPSEDMLEGSNILKPQLLKTLMISNQTVVDTQLHKFRSNVLYNKNTKEREVYKKITQYMSDRLNYFNSEYYKIVVKCLPYIDLIENFNSFVNACIQNNITITELFVVFADEFKTKFGVTKELINNCKYEDLLIYIRKQLGYSVEVLSKELEYSTTKVYNIIKQVGNYGKQ